MEELNELDSTCGVSDEELTKRFEEAVRIDNEIKNKRLTNCQIRYGKKSLILNIRMGEESMHNKPEIIVFAGPNGSGKSTITIKLRLFHFYVKDHN